MLIEGLNSHFAKPVLCAVPSNKVYLEDCNEALKRFSDGYFDIAVVGFEIDKGYFEAQEKRFNAVISQQTLF